MNQDDIIKVLKTRVLEVEEKIHIYETYINKGKRLEKMKKFIYVIECFFPYVISSVISAEVLKSVNHSPFQYDEIKYYENVSKTLYSNGLREKKASTTDFFSEEFCTSTAWILDDDGNYTREEVYYDMRNIDNYEILTLLEMSKEELVNLFPIINQKKYVKNSLNQEDLKYNENLIIITRSYKEYHEEYNRLQTPNENMIDAILCWVLTIIGGVMISKLFVRHRISNGLKISIEDIKDVNIDECQTLLKIRQSNLDLLLDEEEKQLRKVKGKNGFIRFTK